MKILTIKVYSALVLGGVLLVASMPTAFALSVVEVEKLLAGDGASGDRFGNTISIDGDRALIGTGRVTGIASVYVYERTGEVWTQQAKLTPSDPPINDRFAFQVSLDGDTALVGAIDDDDKGTNSGSAYVFEWDGSNWNQQAKLTASDGDPFDYFGRAVYLDGNTALIGALGDDDAGEFSGAVYVFERTGSSWIQQTKIVASDGAAGDRVGPRGSIAIEGDMIFIGSYQDDDKGINSGSVYVYTRSGGAWTQQAKLTASDGAAGDGFGYRLAYSGNTAIIAAPFNDGAKGSVYVFEWDGSNWIEQGKLTASDGAAFDYFGLPVDMDGNTIVIGALEDDDNGDSSGSAYLFTRIDGVWSEKAKLTPGDGAILDRFGEGAFVDGDSVLVGAIFDDDLGSESGSVFVFVIDTDDDGIRDSIDNCPFDFNTDQSDNDNDLVGDICDPDDDNDGVSDINDLCPDTPLANPVDTNGCTTDQVIDVVTDDIQDLIDDPDTADRARKRLNKALDKLSDALEELVQGDVKKSLKKTSDAVKKLLKAANDGTDVSGLIDQLVEGARSQAQNAIDAAIAADGDQKKIDKAQKAMDKAQEDMVDNKPDKAIDHYTKAWDFADKA